MVWVAAHHTRRSGAGRLTWLCQRPWNRSSTMVRQPCGWTSKQMAIKRRRPAARRVAMQRR